MVDDFEVTKALFSKLVEWAKEIGMEEIIGPMSFSDLNEEGMLIEGFDKDSTYIEIYNHPYYVTHMENFTPTRWWIELLRHQSAATVRRKADTNCNACCKTQRLRNSRRQTYGEGTWTKASERHHDAVSTVLDEAFADLYGTSPLNEKQKQREMETLLQVFVPELACAVMKDGKVVCYGFCMPSMLKVLQKGVDAFSPAE